MQRGYPSKLRRSVVGYASEGFACLREAASAKAGPLKHVEGPRALARGPSTLYFGFLIKTGNFRRIPLHDRHPSQHHATLHLWNPHPLASLRLCGVRFGNRRFQETHVHSFLTHFQATLVQELLLQSILRLHGRNHDLLHSVPFGCHGLDP